MMVKLGRYEMKGQPPIVVTDNSDMGNGMHGPWVHYRFEWETDDKAKPVLWIVFEQLLGAGYQRVEE